jgi:hypothetical protein
MKKQYVCPAWQKKVLSVIDSVTKEWTTKYEEELAKEKALAKAKAEEIKLQRNYSKWLERQVDKITIRMNDGTNQCLPPQVWLVLGQRLAA